MFFIAKMDSVYLELFNFLLQEMFENYRRIKAILLETKEKILDELEL